MRRIFQLFHTELSGVHQAAFLLALATIASNILGMFRDRLLASSFGAGVELDMYYAAFRIPDFLYAVSLFFAASTAVIPVFLETAKENEPRAKQVINSLFTIFVLAMIVILGAAFVVMPALVGRLFPGFDLKSAHTVSMLSRILLLSPLFLGVSNLVSSVVQSYRRFFVYALSPLCYNLGIIVGILFLAPRFGLAGIVWGVALGAFLHFAIQLPSLLALGYLPRFVFSVPAEIRSVLAMSLPRTLGLTASQLTFLAVTGIASTLGAGSIAVFNLSYNLQSIPLAVIGLSYSVAAFPTMAELIVKNKLNVFLDHLIAASRHIVFWTLPVSVLFIVLRAQIVRTLYGAGAFNWEDTRLTAACLALFALGIVAQSLVLLFVRAFYAVGKTTLPVIINVLSSLSTIAASFLFVHMLSASDAWARTFAALLRVGDIPGAAVLGLPLAFALGSILNAILLGFGFGYVESEFKKRKLVRSLGDIAGGSVLLAGVSYGGLALFARVFNLNTFLGIFLQGLSAGLCGIALAALFLYIRKNAEFMDISKVLRQKFWQSETVAPEPEHLL